MMMLDPMALELLQSIRDEIRGLRADLAVGRNHRRLAPADHAMLVELLPLLVAVVGCSVFAVADLVAHAGADAQTVLAAVGGPRKLGMLLRRADGLTVAGYRIDRIGADRAGALWSVTAKSRESHTDQ